MADFDNPDDLQDYLEVDNIVLEDTDSSKSYQTNFLIINRNFLKFKAFLLNVHNFTVWLYNQIDIANIVQQVLDNLNNLKVEVEINSDLLVDTTDISNGYVVKRLANNVVEVTRQLNSNDWVTDRLICMIKNVDKQQVYPVIETKDNKITIYFIDGISSNYVLQFI